MRQVQFKRLAIALAATVSAAALAPAANASVIITVGATTTIPNGNDFKSSAPGLGTLGYTQYTNGASSGLFLDTNSTITFEVLGSESGANDTYTTFFATPNVTYTETNNPFPAQNNFAAPISIGGGLFAAGDLAGKLVFTTTANGTSVTVGSSRFAIFLQNGQGSGAVSSFLIGFDDQVNGADSDYDDLIIRATVTPAVPEPATWAMMLVGFGAMGWAMRRRRQENNQVRYSVTYAA